MENQDYILYRFIGFVVISHNFSKKLCDIIILHPSTPPSNYACNDCRMTTRFNIWTISRYASKGIYLKGDNFTLLPYDGMNDDEKKWVWLFRRGYHKVELSDEYDGDSTDFDKLTDFDLSEYNPKQKDEDDLKHKDEDDLCGQMTNLLIKDDEERKETEKMRTTMTLMKGVEIENDLISVSTLMTTLTEQNCPDDMMVSLFSLIKEKKTALGYGEGWVKMKDVEKRLKTMITPDKKKMTDDERKKKLKKMTDEKEKRVLKMGLGDTKERIGEVMRALKESIDDDTTSPTTSLDEIEKAVNDGLNDVEMMVDLVSQIETKLSHANNLGVRLVTLRGQIFALYQGLNPSATNVEIGQVFGVSSGVVSSSMSFARLVVEYPAFGLVTLPFTTIVRNLKRIRKWLETASDDDKLFWMKS